MIFTLINGAPIETFSKILWQNSIKTTHLYSSVIDSKISAYMIILRTKFF